MAKTILDIPEATQDVSAWVTLLEETKAEIKASAELTDEEKHQLDQIDGLPEAEWQPVACSFASRLYLKRPAIAVL